MTTPPMIGLSPICYLANLGTPVHSNLNDKPYLDPMWAGFMKKQPLTASKINSHHLLSIFSIQGIDFCWLLDSVCSPAIIKLNDLASHWFFPESWQFIEVHKDFGECRHTEIIGSALQTELCFTNMGRFVYWSPRLMKVLRCLQNLQQINFMLPYICCG